MKDPLDDDKNIIVLATHRVTLKRSGWCRHKPCTIDSDRRKITCNACEAQLDPFDVLLAVARDLDQYKASRAMYEKDAKRAFNRLEELKRQERNAKARLRRLSKT